MSSLRVVFIGLCAMLVQIFLVNGTLASSGSELRIQDLKKMFYPTDVLYTMNEHGRPACLSFTLRSSRTCVAGYEFYKRTLKNTYIKNLYATNYLRHCSAQEVAEEGHWCKYVNDHEQRLAPWQRNRNANFLYRLDDDYSVRCLSRDGVSCSPYVTKKGITYFPESIRLYQDIRCDYRLHPQCGDLTPLIIPTPASGVNMLVYDDFRDFRFDDLPFNFHGAAVAAVARGAHDPQLTETQSVSFYFNHWSGIDHSIPLTLDIINASVNSTGISSVVADHLQHFMQPDNDRPLLIFSAGNGGSGRSCHSDVAEVGRTLGLGLTASSYAHLPQPFEYYYHACNMIAVDMIDRGYQQQLIIAGASNGLGQRPGDFLMHRWVSAPYSQHLMGMRVQGTSFSAPYIAAIAAEIKALVPSLSASEVADIIFQTATDQGEPGVDAVYGHGVVNPAAIRERLAARGYYYSRRSEHYPAVPHLAQ